MRGDPLVLYEGFQGRIGQGQPHSFMDQLLGETAVMVIHLDVVINVDLGRFPLCKDELNVQGSA